MGLGERIRRSWNIFTNKDPTTYAASSGMTYSQRPDRPRLTRGNEKSIITSVIVRMALDVASIDFRHCQLNEEDCYEKDIDSELNQCLTLAANIDQTHRAFIQDVAMTMMDKGCVAIVPVDIDTKDDSKDDPEAYDILSMRVGEILEWKPAHIRVRVYDDQTGLKKNLVVPKSKVAIIENPLYAIMNEPNSAMQRLIRKLSLLDVTDEQTASGKLDLIIQLPYVVKSEARRKQADERRNDIAMQLAGSQYGIAYTDGTEKITQLNRPVENTLMPQIQYLMEQVFSQIGMTQSILDGTANEQTMLNYYNRAIEPIVAVIVDSMKRTFLTKKERAKKQSITAFRDPFKLVPVNQIAEIADKFTRNEVFTANEIRQIVGRKPSKDPKANQLRNSNISQAKQNGSNDPTIVQPDPSNNKEGDNQNGN